jgi:hypothetical protein
MGRIDFARVATDAAKTAADAYGVSGLRGLGTVARDVFSSHVLPPTTPAVDRAGEMIRHMLVGDPVTMVNEARTMGAGRVAKHLMAPWTAPNRLHMGQLLEQPAEALGQHVLHGAQHGLAEGTRLSPEALATLAAHGAEHVHVHQSPGSKVFSGVAAYGVPAAMGAVNYYGTPEEQRPYVRGRVLGGVAAGAVGGQAMGRFGQLGQAVAGPAFYSAGSRLGAHFDRRPPAPPPQAPPASSAASQPRPPPQEYAQPPTG